jgi:transposase
MTGVLHALCNAHHLRELKALVQVEKVDWARRMQRLMRRACQATNLAHEPGVPVKPRPITLIERCSDTVLAEGMTFHEAQPAPAKPRLRGGLPRRVGQHPKVGRAPVPHRSRRALHQQPCGTRWTDA